MSKVQQTYGLQITTAVATNSLSTTNLTNTSQSSSSSSSLSLSSATESSSSTINSTSVISDPKLIDNQRPLITNDTNKQEILKHNEQKQKMIRKRQLVCRFCYRFNF